MPWDHIGFMIRCYAHIIQLWIFQYCSTSTLCLWLKGLPGHGQEYQTMFHQPYLVWCSILWQFTLGNHARQNIGHITVISHEHYGISNHWGHFVQATNTGGRFKNTYELLNLRALKISPVNKIHIFQCMSKIFCVEFQRYPLKFHTKYLTHTLKDTIFIQHWNFKSS